MATILYVGTYGTDDATRGTFPFLSASGALDAGHRPQVALLGEATYLIKDNVLQEVHGVAVPPLKDLFAKLVGAGAEIFV